MYHCRVLWYICVKVSDQEETEGGPFNWIGRDGNSSHTVLEESPGAIAGATASSDERQERVIEPLPGGVTPEREDNGEEVKPYTLPQFEPLSTSSGSMACARVKGGWRRCWIGRRSESFNSGRSWN